jgi:hypothetical protein
VPVAAVEQVPGDLGGGGPVVDADPRHGQGRRPRLVDHHQRYLPGDGRGQHRVVVGEGAHEQPVDDRAGDRGGTPPG